MIEFYESELGQVIYSWRGISVEPLIEPVNRTYQRCLQNRPIINKRVSESIWHNSTISTDLSNHCLLQLQDTQTTSKSYQTHVR